MRRSESRVEGIRDDRWSAWFGGLAISSEPPDVTVIRRLPEGPPKGRSPAPDIDSDKGRSRA